MWRIIHHMPESSLADLKVGVWIKPARVETNEPQPFRIGVFGDFSGRTNHGAAESAASARPIAIDRDNFDQVLRQLAPALEIAIEGSGSPVPLSFSSLDDFHPDSLFRRMPLFAKLRDLRNRLKNPHTFREAAAELTGATRTQTAPRPNLEPASPAGGSLLDAMLRESEAPAARRQQDPGDIRAFDLQAFINDAVAGHLAPEKGPQQDQLLANVDAAIGDIMRRLLRHPAFKALETAWRALNFLTDRLETGVNLKIVLFDRSCQELRDDLNGATNLRATAFYRDVVTNASSEPWALLVGNFDFSAQPEDVDLLARIALTVHAAGAPFLTAAHPSVLGAGLGSDSLTDMPDPRDWDADTTATQFWNELRELPEASSLGMLMPRFLLRLPYGKETNPTEEFSFEEMPGVPAHDNYLWGNPAIAGACLLGQTFSQDGWRMRPGAIREISGLPLHIYRHEGESTAQPCAEAWLTDRTAEFILERGVMPLVSARDGDRVLLVRFQSVASPPKALAGRW